MDAEEGVNPVSNLAEPCIGTLGPRKDIRVDPGDPWWVTSGEDRWLVKRSTGNVTLEAHRKFVTVDKARHEYGVVVDVGLMMKILLPYDRG
ncbi:hypothetical protein N7463_006117 [Penicillium fimorum]|uniref:Uncharacterized protein n=1 Tax=Penicillium fimorum TaxID=1882269 RepID=A0A9W9XTR4_9EURO|nr:hypothetical protein N7463_006117 [Penicillium fimorum]